jgi:hypothetical protein
MHLGCRIGLAVGGSCPSPSADGRWGILAGPRVAAVDPGPGGRLAVTELLARVGGSSVSLNSPWADQGGRHVDMVVGADHRGRAGVGVWRDATAGPLTGAASAARSWLALLLGPGRRPGGGAGGSRPSGRSRPSALPGPAGSGTQSGLGPVVPGHREQFVAGRSHRSARAATPRSVLAWRWPPPAAAGSAPQ